MDRKSEPQRRVDDLIRLHNKLSEYLRVDLGLPGDTYSERVQAALRAELITPYEASRLDAYRRVRNVLTHNVMPREDGNPSEAEVIAYPTDETLHYFRDLVNQICAPPSIARMGSRDLRVFDSDEVLVDALRYMRSHDFSQIIVRSGSALQLLTVEGVARWLEQQVVEDSFAIETATVGDALDHERPNNFVILARKQSEREARSAFARGIDQGYPRIYAVIVTENGKDDEPPICIVTPWDLLEVARG